MGGPVETLSGLCFTVPNNRPWPDIFFYHHKLVAEVGFMDALNLPFKLSSSVIKW